MNRNCNTIVNVPTRPTLSETPVSSKGRMPKGKAVLFAAAAAVASIFGASARTANASSPDYLLQDRDSSVWVNPTTDGTNPDGMYSWNVDGKSELQQQWLWYRLGSTGPQSRFNTLTQSAAPVYLDTNANAGKDYLQLSYTSPGNTFKATVTYSLNGGKAGSGTSDIGETIKITNTSSSTLDYHLFQYADFDLGGVNGGQNLTIHGGNTATQISGDGLTMSETVATPKPTRFQAGSYPSLLNALDTSSGLVLNDQTTATSTDAEWAFEWDVAIAPGSSLVISADKQIHSIPEPATTITFLGLGGMFLMRPRRRDEDPDPRMAHVAGA